MTDTRNLTRVPNQTVAAQQEFAIGAQTASADIRASERRPRSDVDGPFDRWENEGGAVFRGGGERQYGRRVEADGSWTVYHVFTGIPAFFNGRLASGLSRAEATIGMLSLNRRNENDRWSRTRVQRESVAQR